MSEPIQKGMLLLSEPHLADAHFIRSVVCIVEHHHQGTVGFVLNQPLGMSLSDVMEGAEDLDFPLYCGGPCEEDMLHYIHTRPDAIENSAEIIPGVHWGGNHEQLFEGLRTGEIEKSEVKFFVGYSGWGVKQLEGELEMQSWIITKVRKELIFREPVSELWKDVLISLGPKFALMANAPIDPHWN